MENHIQIYGCGVLASSGLFLLKDYQEMVKVNPITMMKGTITGIPGKHATCWTTYWYNNNFTPETSTKYLHIEVMKCDATINKGLFQEKKIVDEAYLDHKPKQKYEKADDKAISK